MDIIHIVFASVRDVLVEACSVFKLKISSISPFVEILEILLGMWTDTSTLPTSSSQQWLIGLWMGLGLRQSNQIFGI